MKVGPQSLTHHNHYHVRIAIFFFLRNSPRKPPPLLFGRPCRAPPGGHVLPFLLDLAQLPPGPNDAPLEVVFPLLELLVEVFELIIHVHAPHAALNRVPREAQVLLEHRLLGPVLLAQIGQEAFLQGQFLLVPALQQGAFSAVLWQARLAREETARAHDSLQQALQLLSVRLLGLPQPPAVLGAEHRLVPQGRLQLAVLLFQRL